MKAEAVIGLEVHAHLKTRTKMFCRCENLFGRDANTLTCPVCLGMPGALPVANAEAVWFAVKTGLALGAAVHGRSVFARKNYFYPDMPKGYQISQYEEPLCTNGRITIRTKEGPREIRIRRIHLEEDAGKLLHGDSLVTKEGSLVDLNRCGVPLAEIVSEPDLRTAEEASEYLKELRSILRYLEVCDGNMEEGSFRCDANVSVRKPRAEFGTKVEIKNMNSFKHVQKAVRYEIDRQAAALEGGRPILQETRLWNPDKEITVPMRSKEREHDYRYFPDPDLPPLVLPRERIEEIRKSLPELPSGKRERYERSLGLPQHDAELLTAERETAEYFEETLELYQSGAADRAKKTANFIMAEILRIANERGASLREIPVPPGALAELLRLKDAGTISGKMAKEIVNEMAATGKGAARIVREKGHAQLSDRETIREAVRRVLAQNPTQLAAYRAGKEKLFGYFVGQVMKDTGGKSNPDLVNALLREEIDRGV